MRILVVEDETRLGRAIKRGLEKQGFAVDHMDNGKEAAEHIYIHHSVYDLIVLDLMLPDMTGEEICQAVRERDIQTPILILTAKEATANKVVLLNSGADDYMVKPFSFAELIARVRAILRRPDEQKPTEYTAGAVRLTPAYHKVFINEKELELTVKEFAILEFFMQHQDEVLDRERILDHVWDFNFNSLSNVVDVHVKNLRKKLHTADPEHEYIETVSGVGYRFSATT